MADPDVLLEPRRPGSAARPPGQGGVDSRAHAGHLCLHDEAANLLLTGDHVLPRISPNIGLQPHAAEPPLAAYLRSLEFVAAYDQR